MEQIVDIQEMKIVNAGSIKQTASHSCHIYFRFEKVKSNRTKATCPKFLIFKMYEEKVSEPKLNAD